jgi:hypothetical protein
MKHPILERFEKARRYNPQEYNCVSAAYFLSFLDDEEQNKGRGSGFLEETDSRLIRELSLDNAILLGLDAYGTGNIIHLAVFHPYDKGTILHRPGPNQELIETRIKDNIWLKQDSTKYVHVYFSIDYTKHCSK